MAGGRPSGQARSPRLRHAFGPNLLCATRTWLMCTADTCAEQTEEWLGELGSDLQGPMDSCCFFLVATIFWATSGQRDKRSPREAGFQRQRMWWGPEPVPVTHYPCSNGIPDC